MTKGVWFLLLTTQFFATALAGDVSKFDVQGIKLGQTYREIESKLYELCGEKESWKNNSRTSIGSKSWKDFISCNKYAIWLTRHEKTHYVSKEIKFTGEPSIEEIEKQLYSKYGKPDEKGYEFRDNFSKPEEKEYIKTFCWGEYCSEYPTSERAMWRGTTSGAKKGINLNVRYSHDSMNNMYSIRLVLRDFDMGSLNREWIKNYKSQLEDEQKKKTSNLGL
ncbi:MAG: hypothetical protein OI74_09345 [Gammaproteobacteria bacterium (ex Lamellibrachia satsuma)]|nr:MAG: hypothetical protein HPY30_11180 [Gammaproteobacteria bacterium (ex Lamellibrachia satsuma)]RRS33030.1 MAG: hypothetical protein OI74_09345 [Gammaproteobacteria bacterium (ex Lamellibrachia satsuma)]RRS33881.1 MAG: hypothetical protein NV67_15165 [Gammaproteobacteria bacterium (ex Lamellibrachia satsuma)]